MRLRILVGPLCYYSQQTIGGRKPESPGTWKAPHRVSHDRGVEPSISPPIPGGSEPFPRGSFSRGGDRIIGLSPFAGLLYKIYPGGGLKVGGTEESPVLWGQGVIPFGAGGRLRGLRVGNGVGPGLWRESDRQRGLGCPEIPLCDPGRSHHAIAKDRKIRPQKVAFWGLTQQTMSRTMIMAYTRTVCPLKSKSNGKLMVHEKLLLAGGERCELQGCSESV